MCVTDSQIADPFIDPLIVTCAVSNAAQDNAISYTIYMNGTLLVAAGKQEVNNVNFSPFVKIYGPGVTAVTYNNPADFIAFGTYTCVASTIWGTSNTTINFGLCSEFHTAAKKCTILSLLFFFRHGTPDSSLPLPHPASGGPAYRAGRL